MRRDPRPHYLSLAVAFCVLGLAILALIFFTGCASSKMGKALNVSVVISAGADYASTRDVINSGRGRELNPRMGQGALQQAIVKAIGATGVIAIAWLIELKGQNTLAHVVAHVVRLVAIASWSAATIHNAGVGR